MDETGIGVALGLTLFVGMILAGVIFGGVFIGLAIVVCVPVVLSLIMFDDVVATLCCLAIGGVFLSVVVLGGFVLSYVSVGVLFSVAQGLVLGVAIVMGILALLSVISVFLSRVLSSRRLARLAPAGVPAGLPLVAPAPRSLRWVGALLPGEEGTVWWAEVTSCLAETPDPDERRRYLRSYRRKAPQLVWTSWIVHLSASRPRELR